MSPSVSLDLGIEDDGVVRLLRPERCPFCGSDAVDHDSDLREETHWIACCGCAAEGPTGRNAGEAVRRWNARVER